MSPKRPSSPCSRSRIEPRFSLLLIAVLTITSCIEGCGQRTVSERYQWTTLRTARVQGKIEWQGRLEADYVEIVATAEPQSIAGAGDAGLQMSVPRHQGGRNSVTYRWDLDVEKRATITRIERVWGVARSRSVRHQSYAVRYQLLRLRPPDGWTAAPAGYRITKNTKNVDFVLRREQAPAQ